MGLIVDNFAGGGGASLGISMAAGRPVDIAINHDAAAIEMHAVNHPASLHLCEDVFAVSPRKVTRGRPVGLAWFSPDCKHFSRAKGGKPVEKKIRGLAWVAVRWAKEVRPALIVLENVREFQEWGPLLEDGRPCPRRKGLTFKRFTGNLRGLGYQVETRVLNAADYGAPTHRRRLFLIARCDGRPIVWPEPTHGPPGKTAEPGLFSRAALPWRTAAECIDWSLPCPSIFDRKKPLAEKTLRRIAMGLKRYVFDNPTPFIISVAHTGTTGRGVYQDRIDDPLKTITHSNDKAIVTPYLAKFRGDSPGTSAESPMPTITSGDGAARPAGAAHALGIVAPTLIQTGYGERAGQAPRAPGLDKPLGTVVAGGPKHAQVCAFLSQFYGTNAGKGDPRAPLPTTTADGQHAAIAAAYLIRNNHGEKQANGVDEPAPTITTQGNKIGLVQAFLIKYFGCGCGQECTEPLHTVTVRDRFGLVTVEGLEYQIVDIGLRMLTPRELARAQGFPDDYVLTGSKSNQVAKIGNSVSPPVARAIVAANFNERAQEAVA